MKEKFIPGDRVERILDTPHFPFGKQGIVLYPGGVTGSVIIKTDDGQTLASFIDNIKIIGTNKLKIGDHVERINGSSAFPTGTQGVIISLDKYEGDYFTVKLASGQIVHSLPHRLKFIARYAGPIKIKEDFPRLKEPSDIWIKKADIDPFAPDDNYCSCHSTDIIKTDSSNGAGPVRQDQIYTFCRGCKKERI